MKTLAEGAAAIMAPLLADAEHQPGKASVAGLRLSPQD